VLFSQQEGTFQAERGTFSRSEREKPIHGGREREAISRIERSLFTQRERGAISRSEIEEPFTEQ
jgi:hypothetical protein